MSLLTDFLKLFKWDTTSETDLDEEFDIDAAMNENWDKIDAKAKEHDDKINTLEEVQAEQNSSIQKLKDNMINLTTEEDTSLYITDAGTPPAKLTIRGNHRQEVQEGTDNLAVLNEGTIEQNGITVNVSNGEVIFSGTNTASSTTNIKIGTAYLYAGQTYYQIKTGSQSSFGARIQNSNGVQHWFSNTESSFICETTEEWDVYVSAGASQTVNATFKVMLSKTSGAEWVQGKKTIPSLEYPSEIETVKDEVNVVVSNKNMFNVPSSNLYGVEITLQEDGSYLINGTSTASWAFRVGEPVWLGAGDYVLSMEASSPLYQGGVEIQGSNNFKYELWDTSNKSIHLTEDKKVQCYFAFNINATYDNVVVKIQLEKSNTKTDWVKHEEIKKTLDIQQEMLKGDYFDLENDKEVCGFKKKIFTGTETISATVNGNSFSYIASDILADTNTIKIPKIYSNCYSACSWQDRNTNNKPNTVSAYNITIGFDKGNFATVEEFKAELAKRYSEGNPVYVIYPLAENEELDLTETQKQQLAQLNNLDLFKGINNIYTEEGIALMQLDYTADTKMYIDNLVTQNTAESEG